MGQADALEFLEEHPDRWFTSKEIAKGIDFSIGSTTQAMRRLTNHGDVERKDVGEMVGHGITYVYRLKR